MIITFDLFKKEYFIVFLDISSIHRPTWKEMDKELLKPPLDGRLPQRREGAHPVGHLGEGAPHLSGYETRVWEVGAT